MQECRVRISRGRRCFLQVPFGSSSLQPLYLLLCHKKSTYVTHLNSASAAENFKETKRAIDDLYSTEQKSTVLQLLNSASEKELSAVKLMRGRKSMNIIEYRNKHGPFRNLQCLLEVPLFQYKTAVKVCNFILNPNAKEERKEKKIQSVTSAMKYIKPDIERERLEISSVISRLPEADFYVLEKSGLSALNANLFPVTLHLRTVEAMLYALLQKTFSQDGQYKVLSMARSAVGKHFELMVGDSRTSGIDLVKQFLLESVTHAEPRVNFSREQVVNYRNVLSSNKQWRDEELCDSLLQAIAFYELLILNNTT
ncbi:transcription elongation factor, mitochondrial isoform X1 [Podarcis lilfordi]|uniref:Transcription elongation factor, mitochondrial n=1 Tax=Podarcis lilfordi TaxID=74358 RepID=A0AA35NVC5_9SAUR|nr:transcription elongation factor, mitochondrial isoform X1 [Podarcis lilfordi]